MLFLLLVFLVSSTLGLRAETSHKVYNKGTDAELDVYIIKGRQSGPTLLLLGGIQGDEPGGYLAADLYADISLRKGTMIVVPRANFYSIVKNKRGVRGDMNRKFASGGKAPDADVRVVDIIKELMHKSDYFLNLHDGSGFFYPTWESPLRNPSRFGQSIIADAETFARSDGSVVNLGNIAERVIARVNPQITNPKHLFRFNNHRTKEANSAHKEQRRSATFHALTRVGIPAFGVETSKTISDFSLRVRYQAMVINAFLEEFGILPDNPRIFLERPYLKYLILSVNGRTPIVVKGDAAVEVRKGDSLRIVHIESNYSRGLSARIKGSDSRFNHMNQDLAVKENTIIEVRKDRFLVAEVPIKIVKGRSRSATRAGLHFEPAVRHFCIRVNGRTFVVQPGEEFAVAKGDAVVILDPKTNLDPEDERAMRIDLRGFQAASSPYPTEDRGHIIDTAKDLQVKYGRVRGNVTRYSVLARLGKKVIGKTFLAVKEARLDYVVLRGARVAGFVAYPGDRLELPENEVVRIMDVRTNLSESTPMFVTMAGRTVRWRRGGTTGIDASKLTDGAIPLDITCKGRSLGRIWVKRGERFRVLSGGGRPFPEFAPVGYR